jgi:hypothetical protein
VRRSPCLCPSLALAVLLAAAAASTTARSLEAADGRLDLHGYYELQVRHAATSTPRTTGT